MHRQHQSSSAFTINISVSTQTISLPLRAAEQAMVLAVTARDSYRRVIIANIVGHVNIGIIF